jgi:hypothetical protein
LQRLHDAVARLGRAELVELGDVQRERALDVLGLIERGVDAHAVVADGHVRIGAARSQVGELAAEAEAQHADLLLLHFGPLAQRGDRGLHVFHALGLVEAAVEREGALPVFRRIAEFDIGLLAPEEVGHQHHVAFFRVVVGHLAHGVVDAEDLLRDHQARAAAGLGQCEVAVETAAAVGGLDADFLLHVNCSVDEVGWCCGRRAHCMHSGWRVVTW